MLGPHAQKLPIFMGHGTADPVLKFAFGESSAQLMTSELGFKCANPSDEKPSGLIFNKYEGLVHSE